MLPSYHLLPLPLGPLNVYPWGVFVSAGFLAGLAAAFWFLKKHKAGAERIFDLVFWIILGAVAGSRLFHILFYQPSYFFYHPGEIWQIWQGGLSSLGGILGGVLTGLVYFKKKRLNFYRWADALAFGLPLGWVLGRLGCFFTHQHWGVKNQSFLSVLTPDGPRLEMSVIEVGLLLLLFLFFLYSSQRTRPKGFYAAVLAAVYGGARFILDFWRSYGLPNSDARYFGLTPAQYAGAILFVFGAALLFRIFKKIKNKEGRIKAVIYDMDDTMVNSQPLHVLATNLMLKEYGYDAAKDLGREEKSEFVGKRVIDVLAIIKKDLNLAAPLDELFTRRQKIFLDLVKNKLEVLPGLKKSLNFFKKNNFKIALASSAVREYIDLVLEKFSLKNYFEVIIAGDMVKKGKPDPETYLKACQELGLPPARCLVLEDSQNGIESAKRAGCLCLAVKNNHTPPQDRNEADAILNSLEEVDEKVVELL